VALVAVEVNFGGIVGDFFLSSSVSFQQTPRIVKAVHLHAITFKARMHSAVLDSIPSKRISACANMHQTLVSIGKPLPQMLLTLRSKDCQWECHLP
jgi:hypothetical protein